MDPEELREFLDQKAGQYNAPFFIECDPVSIPHRFVLKEDIEIAAFLTAVISWGNRKSILASAGRLMHLMDEDPYRFVMDASEHDLLRLQKFIHRTFLGTDCIFFIRSLQRIYRDQGGLEQAFHSFDNIGAAQAIHIFKQKFFHPPHERRTEKHLPDPLAGSSAKRINMFLRWMVRKDDMGVDFGIWNSISPASLACPLDVHSGNVARKLGLLTRKANDWKAVMELTEHLKVMDPVDPAKYDIALFGLGVFEKF